MADGDPTPREVEEVRQRILRHRPDEAEVMEPWSLLKTAHYLKVNGYLEYPNDDTLDGRPETSVSYFVYDILKWTEQNA